MLPTLYLPTAWGGRIIHRPPKLLVMFFSLLHQSNQASYLPLAANLGPEPQHYYLLPTSTLTRDLPPSQIYR